MRRVFRGLFLAGLLFLGQSSRAAPPIATPDGDASAVQPSHDGQHDFDFDLGRWRTHSLRLLHPLSGSTRWVEMDGFTTVRELWDGRANLAEFKADGPAGPIELLSLRWYNANTHEWNLDFATPGVGTLGIPGVGVFTNGRGDFYDQETMGAKTIFVRFSIWEIDANSARSEQAFSDDGGKSWEVNWINQYTRIIE
jgi:hypothetical protein